MVVVCTCMSYMCIACTSTYLHISYLMVFLTCVYGRACLDSSPERWISHFTVHLLSPYSTIPHHRFQFPCVPYLSSVHSAPHLISCRHIPPRVSCGKQCKANQTNTTQHSHVHAQRRSFKVPINYNCIALNICKHNSMHPERKYNRWWFDMRLWYCFGSMGGQCEWDIHAPLPFHNPSSPNHLPPYLPSAHPPLSHVILGVYPRDDGRMGLWGLVGKNEGVGWVRWDQMWLCSYGVGFWVLRSWCLGLGVKGWGLGCIVIMQQGCYMNMLTRKVGLSGTWCSCL